MRVPRRIPAGLFVSSKHIFGREQPRSPAGGVLGRREQNAFVNVAKSEGMPSERATAVRSDGGRRRSKVTRVVDEYGLDGLEEELERRWLATDDSGMSLRELADHFNRRVLRAAIEESDVSTLEVDVDRTYEQLTSDDVSSGVRTRVQRRLERDGVDVDAVREDFLTHQSIHTYLREHRGVEQPDPTPEERRESATERVQKLQDRSAAVTRDALEALQREGLVPDGEFDVVVDVRVIYTESGEQYNVFDLLEE